MEDPTIALCRGLPGSRSNSLPTIVSPKMKLMPVMQNDIIGDRQLYANLDQIKARFDRVESAKFTRARNMANPYENVVSHYFMTRAATKLANIDWVFDLIPSDIKQFTPVNPFRYVDLGAAPGSFSQYLQYRFPSNSLGYAFSLAPDKGGLAWKPEHLRTVHWVNNPNTKAVEQVPILFLLPPPKGQPTINSGITTGDLVTEYPAMITFIGTKVHLIVSDAAFENGGDTLSLENGFINLFVAQLLIIAHTLLPGGNCCIKLFSSSTKAMMALLCIARTLFNQMYIFKPMSSRPGSDERYFVGIGRNEINAPIILSEMLSTGQFVELDPLIPSDTFINSTMALNDRYTQNQYTMLENIVRILDGNNPIPDEVDYKTALSIWDIPR